MSIPAKQKPCKGTGVASGLGCGQPTYHRVYGLGKLCGCYSDFLLKTEPGKLIMQKAMLKGKSIVKKEIVKKVKTETREQKDKIKDWSKELQKKINIIVRLIDKDLPCLATQRIAKQFHAGHVFARGGNQTIRFNLHNIHRQSAQSNHFQNDDGLLREGVVREYGIEYMTFISELRRTPALNYSNEDYHQFYKKASHIVLRLQKLDVSYDNLNRLIQRDKINHELGIYSFEYCAFNPF